MGNTAFLLFDSGMQRNLPGFPSQFFYPLLPLLGDYYSFEILLANTMLFTDSKKFLYIPDTSFKEYDELVKEWEIAVNLVPYTNSIASILSHIGKMKADSFIIQDTTTIASVNGKNLLQLPKKHSSSGLVKFSIDSTPVDLYKCKKDVLVDLLSSLEKKIKNPTPKDLFHRLIKASSELVNIPGIIFLQNDLFSFFRFHLDIIGSRNLVHPDIHELIERKQRDSYIGSSGVVKNSIVSPGVKIDGYVENSFLFRNVQIREGAEIIDSVIMPGHTIGKKTTIKNSLILPYITETTPGNTVGEKCIIGGISKVGNRKFSEQIRSGLSVIGFNVEIPGGIQIEPSVCIASGVTKADFKQNKVVKRGSYLAPKV